MMHNYALMSITFMSAINLFGTYYTDCLVEYLKQKVAGTYITALNIGEFFYV